MKVIDTCLPGVRIIEPQVHADSRGLFAELFSEQRYRDEAGIDLPFVQDNLSRSHQGVLRGMHYQRQRPQGKLVQVLAGSVFDVAADINPASPTYGQTVALELSGENHRQLWIPPGYAHGFCVTSETALLHYKCTDYYRPQDEAGVAWNCPVLAITWPIKQPALSDKDQQLKPLSP